jgi:tetratricopeptide (TPR) repeat protein
MGRPARRELSDRELKDRAHALTLKGKYDDAAAIYRGLVAANEGDSGLRLHLAEVYRKRGRLDDAVDAYREAARLLHAAGHTPRARAALSCALQIAPGEPVLVGALRELTAAAPARRLALVPPPLVEEEEVLDSGFEELCDEAVTDPFCPLFDWLEA